TYPARRLMAAFVLAFLPIAAVAQPPAAATPPAAAAEPPKDTIGRDSPRGTLLGFIRAARDGNNEVASLYLNTNLRGPPAQNPTRRGPPAPGLAKRLSAALANGRPARLTEVSDKPEGSPPNPLRPDEDVIGTVTTDDGPLDIVVERVNRGAAGRLWLFSRRTL